jgi:hypothetical protein
MAADDDYLDDIIPEESLGARTSTAAERRAGYEFRALASDYPGSIPASFGPEDEELYRLQVVVLRRLQGRATQPLVRGVLSSRDMNSDVFATFYHGFRRKLIDPNLALMEAARVATAPEAAYEGDKTPYIQLVALALRFGADPNQYVSTGLPELVHVAYWVHRLSEAEREEFGYDSVDVEEYVKTRIIALLILAGSNLNLPTYAADTTRTTVTSMLLRNPDAEKSVFYSMELDLEDPVSDEQAALGDYIQERLTKCRQVVELRKHPYDLPNDFPDYWTAEETLELLYMFDYGRAAEQLPADVLPGEIDAVTEVHAHAILVGYLKRLPDGVVRDTGDATLESASRHLDVTAVDQLLYYGAAPSYELRDTLLNRVEAIRQPLPLSADIICQIFLLFTRYGYALDDAQLRSLQRSSAACVNKLRTLTRNTPLWRAECSIRGGEPTADLREQAREVGLDPSMSKGRLCSALGLLASQDPAFLERVARRRQGERLRVIPETYLEAVEDELALRETRPSKPLRPAVSSVVVPGSAPTLRVPAGTYTDTLQVPDRDGDTLQVPDRDYPPTDRYTTSTTPSGVQTTRVVKKTVVERPEEEESDEEMDPRSPPARTFRVGDERLVQSRGIPGGGRGGRQDEVVTTSKRGDNSQMKVKSTSVRGKCDGDVCTFEADEDVVETTVDQKSDAGGRRGVSIREREAPTYTPVSRPARAGRPERVKTTTTTTSTSDKPVTSGPPGTAMTGTIRRPPSAVIDERDVPTVQATRITPGRQPVPRDVGALSRPAVTRGVLSPPTLVSVATARNNSLSVHSPANTSGRVCVNEAGLRYPADAYADVDIVAYDDSRGRTWCLTSEDYAGLLEQGINPETGEKIPAMVLGEIRGKLATLRSQQIQERPTDISTGLARLKTGPQFSIADTLSTQRVQRLKDYYTIAGLDPLTFTQQYTTEDMQNIVDALYSPSPNLDKLNRNHAMISFATVITKDIDSAASPVERQQEIFDYIGSYSGMTAARVDAAELPEDEDVVEEEEDDE